jgi:hypothetical protein
MNRNPYESRMPQISDTSSGGMDTPFVGIQAQTLVRRTMSCHLDLLDERPPGDGALTRAVAETARARSTCRCSNRQTSGVGRTDTATSAVVIRTPEPVTPGS